MTSINLLPILKVLLPVFAGAWLAGEIGHRLGAFRRERSGTVLAPGVGAMVGSLLALLAFMLAFTFGVAAERFGTRRVLVVDEANAVSTAFLRADLMPPPWADNLREHLREYVDLRLEMAASPEAVAAGLTRSEELHVLMWADVLAGTEARPVPTNALVLQAINDVIDLHSSRVAATYYSRLSIAIWGMLFLVTASGMVAVGYQAGISGPRPSVVSLLLMLALSAVIALIVDLDRPGTGWLAVQQASLQDAAQMMRAPQ